MALTYEESGTLMNDFVFRNRVKVGCLSYASYIMGEAPTVAAHTTRVRWAQNTLISPDQAATGIQPVVVMDPAVLQDGAAITDTALQSAVENAVNKIL
jgi:hypothetical protein